MNPQNEVAYLASFTTILTHLGTNPVNIPPPSLAKILLLTQELAVLVFLDFNLGMGNLGFTMPAEATGLPFHTSPRAWLALFAETGLPLLTMNNVMALVASPLIVFPVLQAAHLVPAPVAPTPAPELAEYVSGQYFRSEVHLRMFQAALPLCSTHINGTVCAAAPSVTGACAAHNGMLALLTSPPLPGSPSIFSTESWPGLRVPCLEDLSLNRPGFNVGKFFTAIAARPSDKDKSRPTPLALHLQKEAKTPFLAPPDGSVQPFLALEGSSIEEFGRRRLESYNPAIQVSQAYYPLLSDFGLSGMSLACPPAGTFRDFLTEKGPMVSLGPVNYIFARFGPAAFPAFASLFGGPDSDAHLRPFTAVYEDLGVPLKGLTCRSSDFLTLLGHYREALTVSMEGSHQHRPSITEIIFRLWTRDNNIPLDLTAALVKARLHERFVINQILVALFDTLHQQAIRLLSNMGASTDPKVWKIQSSIVQAFRNLHSYPGTFREISLSTLESRECHEMANWRHPDSASAPEYAAWTVDPSLHSETELASSRMRAATDWQRGRVYMAPEPSELAESKLQLLNAHKEIARARLVTQKPPSSLSKPSDHVSPRSFPTAKVDSDSSKLAASFLAAASRSESPLGRSKRSISPRPPSPTKGDSPLEKRVKWEDRVPQELRATSERLDQVFLDLVELVPSALREVYKNAISFRLEMQNVACLNPVQKGQGKGFSGVPLYKLFPAFKRNASFCCICGTRQLAAFRPGAKGSPSKVGHLTANCPMIAGSNLADLPNLNASYAFRSESSTQ